MHAFKFLTNGTIDRLEFPSPIKFEDLSLSMANPTYPHDFHLWAAEDRLFFLLHLDNDFHDDYVKTLLPLNQAIQKYFSNSGFVGDALLIKLTDDDNIYEEEWDHTPLEKFELMLGEDSPFAMCFPKDHE